MPSVSASPVADISMADMAIEVPVVDAATDVIEREVQVVDNPALELTNVS